MASNTPEMLECHWGIPIAGAVINAINTRLDPAAIAFCLEHSESSVLLVDSEFAATVAAALATVRRPITVIDILDSEANYHPAAGTVPPPHHAPPSAAPAAVSPHPDHPRLGPVDYEAFLAGGAAGADADAAATAGGYPLPGDEWDAVALGYTSGTTGDPKGVVTHHRGAYLNSLSNAVGWDMGHHARYLWTLPMFHCNGWCFPWTLAAVAGTSVCLRKVTGKNIYDSIADYGVTHLCGAPIVLNFLVNAKDDERRSLPNKVKVMTAAAPPPPSTLEKMQRMGFEVTHVYGLTETYGPAVICSWHPEWDDLPIEEQAKKRARQGVNYHALEDLQVMDPETMTPVPADGATMGEVMFRGNVVMKGYLKNPRTTEKELRGGWFHSGDLGVLHEDGYIELKDRAKDIIITGGENVSSIEVEGVLAAHPQVALAAVVARPDDKWGESVCAFIELRAGPEAAAVTEADIIGFCRAHLAAFKAPRSVVIVPDLPKTSTGKLQKFRLRADAKALGSL